MFRRIAAPLSLSLVGLLFMAAAAFAQVPTAPTPPYNQDLGALLTNTNRAASTVRSATQNNLAFTGVICVLNETAHSGSPSTTIALDAFDAASQTWNTFVTSTIATTGSAGSQSPTAIIAVKPGIQTSSLPTGWTALNMQVPRTWRITQVITGTGFSPGSTSTVGCNYLR
jgi:hypothetical protein